mgnify:CR=1 FL=1
MNDYIAKYSVDPALTDAERTCRVHVNWGGTAGYPVPLGIRYLFFIVRKLRFLTIKKRSARMRTRRKGRWLLKQPRLGARMCQGTSFFILRCLLQPLLLSLRFLFPVRLREPAHILQMYIRKILFHLSWSEVLCNSQTVLSLEYLLQ